MLTFEVLSARGWMFRSSYVRTEDLPQFERHSTILAVRCGGLFHVFVGHMSISATSEPQSVPPVRGSHIEKPRIPSQNQIAGHSYHTAYHVVRWGFIPTLIAVAANGHTARNKANATWLFAWTLGDRSQTGRSERVFTRGGAHVPVMKYIRLGKLYNEWPRAFGGNNTNEKARSTRVQIPLYRCSHQAASQKDKRTNHRQSRYSQRDDRQRRTCVAACGRRGRPKFQTLRTNHAYSSAHLYYCL